MTDYAALADFHRVVGSDGFGEASRSTGRPKSSLVRHVGKLEAEMGVRLLERTKAGIRLTGAGEALHAATRDLMVDLDAACESVGREAGSLRGTLRISAPVLFAEAFMGRVVAGFLAANPEVSIDLVADDDRVDLVAKGFDLVVRVNPEPGSELVGRRFANAKRVIVASAGVPRPTRDEPAFPAMVAFVQVGLRWILKDDGRLVEPEPDIRLRTSSLLALRDAALAGLGAAQLPLFMVEADLEAGRLVCWGPSSNEDAELWILHASRRHASPKVTAFVDFVCRNASLSMSQLSASSLDAAATVFDQGDRP